MLHLATNRVEVVPVRGELLLFTAVIIDVTDMVMEQIVINKPSKFEHSQLLTESGSLEELPVFKGKDLDI